MANNVWWQWPAGSGVWWNKLHGKWWRQYNFKDADGPIIKKWTVKMIGQAPGEVVQEESTETMIA